jgi:hypothetical protein
MYLAFRKRTFAFEPTYFNMPSLHTVDDGGTKSMVIQAWSYKKFILLSCWQYMYVVAVCHYTLFYITKQWLRSNCLEESLSDANLKVVG